jgi:hypothetical protein
MPPAAYELFVEPLEVLDDRQRVHDHQTRDELRMVQRNARGDKTAAVVSNEREPLVPEHSHRRDDIGGHRSLGRLRVFGLVRWQRRAAVSAQVGADDRVFVCQARSDAVPCRVRSRMAVQQYHRWPVASVAKA